MTEDKKITDEIGIINIDANNLDVEITTSNGTESLINTDNKDVTIDQHGELLEVKQKNNNSNYVMNGRGNSFISQSGNNNTIINNNGFVFGDNAILNGINITGYNSTVFSGRSSKIKLSLKKDKKYKIMIKTKSGDITINKIITDFLNIKTMSGDITLNDIDVLIAKLNTMSGDIRAEIIESIINYRTSLNTMSGHVRQATTEKIQPIFADEDKTLIADSMSGNIDVTFKGKR